MKKIIVILGMALLFTQCITQEESYKEKLQQSLDLGWNTYNTMNVLSYVYLPDAFEIALDFMYQGKNFSGYLRGERSFNLDNPGSATIRPLAHTYDGSYTKQQLSWHGINVSIETAVEKNEFFCVVRTMSPTNKPSALVLRTGMLWNKKGHIRLDNDCIHATLKSRNIRIFPATPHVENFNVNSYTPYLVLSLDSVAAFSTGKKKTLTEIENSISKKAASYKKYTLQYGASLASAYQAISTCMAWNTIYDPINKRVISTVSRPWNVERGGYSFFGWDNFFLAWLAALDNKNLAYADVIEHLNEMAEEGFIPNCSQGNGRKTWDRSQPPVGSIMTWKIYQKYPEKWFLEETYDKLLGWNRWWMKRRYYKGMLCWGSHSAKNPYDDNVYNNLRAAMLETGLDDSPMYDNIPFNSDSAVMELHDVGLNALYVADCEALAAMAAILGRKDEEQELTQRASYFRNKLQSLWSEKHGIFLNRRTDNGEFVERLSPTLFYPLMAKAATEQQAQRMLNEHFYNPEEFWGEWIMPSVPRNDPAFEKQRYWKGAIWAPLNFLVYLSLEESGLQQAKKDLAEKSLQLFVKEWERKSFVSENYSAITGTGDDERIKSDRFYTWGALMGILSFMEK